MKKQAGARLREGGDGHWRTALALVVLPVGDLGSHADQGRGGNGRKTDPKLTQRRRKPAGEGLVELHLAGLEALVDAEALDGQASHPVPVLVVELEIGGEPGRESRGRVGFIPSCPVDAAPQQRRHLLLEGGEHRLLVDEVEVERTLGEAGHLHNRANGGGVVAVTLEHPAGRLEQLAAPYPLALGEGRFRRRPATY